MILKFASYRNGSIIHGCICLRSGEPIGLQVTIRADAMIDYRILSKNSAGFLLIIHKPRRNN